MRYIYKKRASDVGSDTSSVWNICAGSSNGETKSGESEMWAVFSVPVYTGPDKFLRGSAFRLHGTRGIVHVLIGKVYTRVNSTQICNRIWTISCERVAQAKISSVQTFVRTRVNAASHAGVSRRTRISSLPSWAGVCGEGRDTRSLKTPAWKTRVNKVLGYATSSD